MKGTRKKWQVRISTDGKIIKTEIKHIYSYVDVDEIVVGVRSCSYVTYQKSKITDELIDDMILKYKEYLLKEKKEIKYEIKYQTEKLQKINEKLNPFLRDTSRIWIYENGVWKKGTAFNNQKTVSTPELEVFYQKSIREQKLKRITNE